MQAQRRFAREDDMTDDMEALLAELNGAGGEVDVGAARPYSKHGRARGTVGSVSVLGEQQRGLARAKSDVSGRGSRPNSGTSAATTAFSTYNVGLTEKEVQNTRHHVTPLGVRLQPLGGSSSPGGQRSPAKVAALPALRSGGDEPLRLESNAPMAFRFAGANDSSPSVEAPTSTEVAPAEPLLALKKPNQPSTAAVVNEVAQGPREANFLPIMCARYLRPSGLTPPARWGHSLTSMSGSALLMFGGMDVSGDETNALMEFSSSTISWDPAFVSRGVPPTARHSHAACAWDGRWLVVHGGTSRSGIVFGDIFIYDTLSCEWECVWASSGTAQRNDPGPRYGHTIVMRDDRLYVFGGRVVKSATSGSTTTALASADVYVFSMSSRRWRKRIRAGGKKAKTEENGGKAKTSTTAQEGASPAPRASHAACLKGDVMYISGGSSTGARVLSDTWSLQLSTNEWRCLHPGEAADAIPRESHALFVCGEALMCVGGCSTSMYNERVSGKFTNFVAVLPLVGQPSPCWIPVAMGNVAIVAPNKKSFGAAFSGGFVYVFGGMCGAEPATNTMVRFLAADGYVSEMEQSSTGSNDDALRGMMQQLRESNPVVPADMFAIAATWGGVNDETGCFVDKEHAAVGFHRQLLVKRAPALLEALLACRSEQLFLGGADTMKHAKGATDGASSQGGGVQVYFTNGTSRVKGLPEPITPDVLSCLADYIYWGGLRSKYRILLEEEEAANGEDEEGSPAGANDGQRTAVLAMMESLKSIANSYQLSPLAALCDALLTRSRRHLQRAREASAECLRKDLLSMMESGTGATLTVLFVDPHTKKQTTCAVHPFVVASASSFFSDLLRPLYTGAKTTFQVGPVAAKVQASTGALPLQCSTSKRAVLVGPVSVPTPAVKSILRFLYTQSLTVRREHAFDTMLGAHQLGLSQLQSYCEAIIAREDVNYDSCCSFYYLSRKYAASLLEEMSLLTAVSGFSSVHQSPGYASLSDADKKSISVVAEELGSNSWVPPPQPKHELKSAAQYESRWKGSAS